MYPHQYIKGRTYHCCQDIKDSKEFPRPLQKLGARKNNTPATSETRDRTKLFILVVRLRIFWKLDTGNTSSPNLLCVTHFISKISPIQIITVCHSSYGHSSYGHSTVQRTRRERKAQEGPYIVFPPQCNTSVSVPKISILCRKKNCYWILLNL